MKYSRLSTAALCGSLTFSILQFETIPANAASKPIIACKKLGQQALVKSIRYTCVKKKGKLIWNEGITINKGVSSTPTPKAPNPLKSTSQRDPFLDSIEKTLNSEIPRISLETVKEDQIGIVIAEDGVDAGNIEATKVILRKLSAAQSIMKLPKPPVIILAVTENFVKTEYAKYCNQDLSWFPNEGTRMENWVTWALVGCLNSLPVQIVPMPRNQIAQEHIADAIGSDMGYIPIGLSDNTSKIPTWFVRGLKGVAGEYMLSMGEDHWVATNTGASRCINVQLRDLSFSYQEIDKNHCDYSLGVAVSRYMVAIKGLIPTLDFINRVQKTGIWSEKICEEFLEIPFEKFEQDAKEYIRKAKL